MKAIWLSVLVIIFPNLVCASFQTARSLSFAGAGGVSGESVDAAFLFNPAVLNLKRTLEYGGGLNRGDLSKDQEQKQYYLWSKDSVSSSFDTPENNRASGKFKDSEGFPLAAALAYDVSDLEGLTNVGYRAYHLAVSKVISKNLSFGGAFRYVDGDQSFHNIDGRFGILWRFSQNLNLGLSWANPIKKQNLDTFVLNQREAFRLGASYEFKKLASIYLDFERGLEDGFKKSSYGLGLEVIMRKYFALRLGAFQKGLEDSLDVGAGLSFRGPRLRVHYGFKRESEDGATVHGVDFSLPL